MSQEPMAFRCWEQWFLTEQFHHVFRPILHSLHGVSLPTAQKHIWPHSIPPGLCSTGSSNIRWLLSEPHKQQLLIKPPLWFFCWPCIRTYCLDLSVYYLWISSLPFLSRFSNYVFCFATSSIRFFGIFVEWPMVTSLPCEPGYRWEHQHFQLQLCWILKDPQQHSARLRPSVERMAQKTPAAFWMEDNLRPPPSRYSRSIIKLLIIEGPNLSPAG